MWVKAQPPETGTASGEAKQQLLLVYNYGGRREQLGRPVAGERWRDCGGVLPATQRPTLLCLCVPVHREAEAFTVSRFLFQPLWLYRRYRGAEEQTTLLLGDNGQDLVR